MLPCNLHPWNSLSNRLLPGVVTEAPDILFVLEDVLQETSVPCLFKSMLASTRVKRNTHHLILFLHCSPTFLTPLAYYSRLTWSHKKALWPQLNLHHLLLSISD